MWGDMDLSSSIPLLQQLVPSVPDAAVRLLNRASLLAGVFLAAAGWEHLGLRGKLQWLFATLSKLKGLVFLYTSRTVYHDNAGIPAFEKIVYLSDGRGLVYDGETDTLVGEKLITSVMPERGYFLLAMAAIALALSSHYSLFHWLSYPFVQLWRAVSEWRQISVHPWWMALIVPLKSIGYAFWAPLSYFLIFFLGLGSILRISGGAAAFIWRRMTERAYNWWLGFSTLIVALTALITA